MKIKMKMMKKKKRYATQRKNANSVTIRGLQLIFRCGSVSFRCVRHEMTRKRNEDNEQYRQLEGCFVALRNVFFFFCVLKIIIGHLIHNNTIY